MVARATAHVGYNFDKVKTRTVEELIYQLIHDVTDITETFPLDGGRAPESLVRAVEQSVVTFISVGEQAIHNCPLTEAKDRNVLFEALRRVRKCGDDVRHVGSEFVRDSSSGPKRAAAVETGRELLKAVANMLILADQIDVTVIVSGLEKVDQLLRELRHSESIAQVEERYHAVSAQVCEVIDTIRRRIGDLRDPDRRDDLLAAQGMLLSTLPLVKTSTTAFVRHPESAEARLNCDYAHAVAHGALNDLRFALDDKEGVNAYSRLNRLDNHLASMLDEFQNKVYVEPSNWRNVNNKELERLLENIITEGSRKLCDAGSTREERRHCIIDAGNELRTALQQLLTAYIDNCGRQQSDDVDRSMVLVGNKTKDLRRHLRRAVVDHVSDIFLDTSTILLEMIEAAKTGDRERLEQNAEYFLQQANGLAACAETACEMSSDVEGIRIIRHIARQLIPLAKQVVLAARLLCSHPESEVIQTNMEHFKEAWLSKVELLTKAVDSIISLDDFLAVSEFHIGEDARHGELALNNGDYNTVDHIAGLIRGRARRVCEAVESEMEALPQTSFSDRIKTATLRLKNDKLPQFENKLMSICSSPSDVDTDRNEYVDACGLVHNGVKEIRNALLLNRNPDEVDSDNEYEDDGHVQSDHSNRHPGESENQQHVMRLLPEKDKQKIKEQIDVFRITQTTFEREVAKWDETGNDIIVLAKHMCTIMMNMTDFTRGRGPLKTTMDVIRAAQEISVAGAKLNALAQQIGEESADSQSKKDLFANISKIPLYCQQLNICSKVKADVQQVGDELIVSGLDSAMSLIQTARNLLSAVVQTVKDAYIASTKFRRANSSGPRVEWRMAPPQMHPLVRPQNASGVIRRASERRPMRPDQALAQFRH